MKANFQITLQIHCHDLPGNTFNERTGVRLGVQKGKEVVDDVPGDAEQVIFTIPLRVEQNTKTGEPNFLGPYAHGTPDERFIYLSWGERNEGQWDMFRRAKILLNHLTWNDIEAAHRSGVPIQASIAMTDDKGGPLCATARSGRVKWRGL